LQLSLIQINYAVVASNNARVVTATKNGAPVIRRLDATADHGR
jgi:hypothetical protein